MQLTGRQLKADKVIDGFESTWKAKGWFERDAPAAIPSGSPVDKARGLMSELEQMQGSDAGNQMTPQAPRPGLQELAMTQ